MANPGNLRAVAAAKASKYGVPVNVFLRQIQQESGFNPNARSPAGALGIAQFIPSTARAYGLSNPFDPVAALDAAARYDAALLHRYGNIHRALSAYNSGRPDAYLDPHFAGGQTYNYVRSILAGAGVPPSVGSPPTGGGPQAVLPPSAATPPVLPPPTQPGLSPALLGLFNQGNQMFGLSPLSSRLLASAPSRLPTAGPPSPSREAAQPTLSPAASSGPPKVKGSTIPFLEHVAAPFGLTVTSTTGGKHAEHSYHYQGRAVDFGGNPQRMAALASYALKHPGEFTEMFYTGPGHPGYFISRGQVLPLSQLDKGLYQEHTNHVHLAR